MTLTPRNEGVFTCACCGGECSFVEPESGWTEKEALKEFEQNFPGVKLENAARVCDPCYKMLIAEVGLGQ